jgi:CTD small phosphatase-like protein 2
MDQKEESTGKDQQPSDIHERINRHPYRHLVGTTIDKESFKKHLGMLYRGTVYSVKFLKGPSEKYLNSKMLTLPEPKCTSLLMQPRARNSSFWTSTRP